MEVSSVSPWEKEKTETNDFFSLESALQQQEIDYTAENSISTSTSLIQRVDELLKMERESYSRGP